MLCSPLPTSKTGLVKSHDAALLTQLFLGKGNGQLGRITNLTNVLSRQGKYEQAAEMHRQTLRLRETVLGKGDPYIM